MSKYIEVQNRLSQILERADVGDRVSRNIDLFLMALVVVNIISITLESVPHIYADHKNLFIWIEIISVGIFTIEYLCRVWVAPRQISGPSGFAAPAKRASNICLASVVWSTFCPSCPSICVRSSPI